MQEIFDFDFWKELAEKDPKEFDRKKREVVETVIQQAHPDRQDSLRDFQRRIDGEIWKSRVRGGSIAVCYFLAGMMNQKTNELATVLSWLARGCPKPMPICLSNALTEKGREPSQDNAGKVTKLPSRSKEKY